VVVVLVGFDVDIWFAIFNFIFLVKDLEAALYGSVLSLNFQGLVLYDFRTYTLQTSLYWMRFCSSYDCCSAHYLNLYFCISTAQSSLFW